MTTQSDYTLDEWHLILQAPALASLFIIQADRYNPIVVIRKTFAALTAITETAQQDPESELIQAVISAVLGGQAPEQSNVYHRDLSSASHWALEGCRQVTAMLAQKAPEAEANAFSRWLIGIGRRVAQVSDPSISNDRRVTGISIRTHRALEMLAVALDMPLRSVADPSVDLSV